jgi:hypothetical protein
MTRERNGELRMSEKSDNTHHQQQLIGPIKYQPSTQVVRSLSDTPAVVVSQAWPRKLGVLSDAALKNPTRIVGGPGSGKSRLLGRSFGWQAMLRNKPQVILDPTGGVVDNLIDKVMRYPEEVRRQLWSQIIYVDVAATDFIVPTPLYYQLRPTDTLYEIANRFPAVIKRADPALVGAPILGLNALNEAASNAGRIAAALGRQVDFVADLIDHPRLYKDELRKVLALYPELEDAVTYFREMMSAESGALRERRTGSFRSKLFPLLADPTMLASVAASTRGIDWESVVRQGQTVLLDFRNELDAERRQFKLIWWFRDFVSYIRQRGMKGRGQEIFFIIDEITQLLGPQTSDGRSILGEDLGELVAVLGRAYATNVILAHQNLTQVSEHVRDILSQCGNQLIGNITNPDDAYYLARQFFRYDPYWEKKREPVWVSVPQMDSAGWLLDYSWPEVIDYRAVEFTAEEQLLKMMEKFRLPRFQFMVRPATAEGTISKKLYRLSIARLDEGQYPDAEQVNQILSYLRQKDGISLDALLAEIRERRKSTTTQVVKMKDNAHPLPISSKTQSSQDDENDDDETFRTKA